MTDDFWTCPYCGSSPGGFHAYDCPKTYPPEQRPTPTEYRQQKAPDWLLHQNEIDARAAAKIPPHLRVFRPVPPDKGVSDAH